jgi:hypothetical protein
MEESLKYRVEQHNQLVGWISTGFKIRQNYSINDRNQVSVLGLCELGSGGIDYNGAQGAF